MTKQTINSLPGADASFMSDLGTFIRDELVNRNQLQGMPINAIISGGVGETDASLTHTIPACVGFPNSYYVSQDATSHTYTATKDTYVYLRDDDARTIAITDYTITYDSNLVFAEYDSGVGSTQPITPSGCLALFKAVTNGTSITAITDLRPRAVYFPEQWGAKPDNSTDSGASIREMLDDIPSGSFVAFIGGAYAITGTTGIPITKSVHFYMNEGSKFVFSDDDTKYVMLDGVNGATFENLTIDSGTPSVRGIYAALHMDDCQNTITRNLRVISCAGAGYFISGGSNHKISDSYVYGTLADGYHWTNQVSRFVGTNLIASDTGDDSFAVVGYESDGGRVTDGNLSGLVSYNSAADGLRISGGERIVAEVSIYNTGVHGLLVQKDEAFSTYSSINCNIRAVIDTTTLVGVCMTNDASDIDIDAIVRNATTRGFSIGASGKTVERITINGAAYNSGQAGFEADYVDQLTVGSMIVAENTGHGFVLVGVTNSMIGSVNALNNNAGADGTSDNVNINTSENVSFGPITSIDDRGTPYVYRALEVYDCDNIVFGSVVYSGTINTTTPVNVDSTLSSAVIFNTPLPFFKVLTPTDTTPVIAGSYLFYTSNGSSTTYTDFLGGYIGQKITVKIGDGASHFDFTGTNLKGNGGSDWDPDQGDWLEAIYDGTYWYCAVHEI